MKTRNRLFWTMPCLAVILFVAASVQAQEMTSRPAMQAAILAEFSIFGDFRQSDNVPFAQHTRIIISFKEYDGLSQDFVFVRDESQRDSLDKASSGMERPNEGAQPLKPAAGATTR